MIKIYSEFFYNFNGILITKKNILHRSFYSLVALDTNFNEISDYAGGCDIQNIATIEWNFSDEYQMIFMEEHNCENAYILFQNSAELINKIINECKIDATNYEFMHFNNYVYKIPINIKICWFYIDPSIKNIILQKYQIINNIFMKDIVIFVSKLLLESFRLDMNNYCEKLPIL
jgi:hypothetical protein